MPRFFRRHGLSLVMLGGFFVTLALGQIIAGRKEYNEERQKHGRPDVTYGEYLKTGHFSEATAENWESEFLQMFVYVVATTFLFLGAFWWHAVGGLRLANEERLQDGETAITLAPEGRGGAFIVCCVIIMKSEPEFHGRGASFTGRTCSLNVSDYFVFFQEGRTFIPPDAAGCGR